ncbi:MAG: SDR family oxidoreductase [Acidobacteriota bacterium]
MQPTERIVLITGASRGIGRAIALRLARERPAHVVVGYCMDHAAAAETVAALGQLGVEASALAGDLGREDSLNTFFDQVAAHVGRLDVFVSNAARAAFGPATELSSRSWGRTLDLNATAFLLGARRAAALMPDGGRIVGVSSLGADFCPPGYAALGAAKAALESLARYLAVELAPRAINVNVVSGGLVDTPSSRRHPDFERLATEVASRTPEGRIGQVDDLAGVVAFLCGPDAAWVRGQTVIADGGYSLAL